MAGVYLCRVWAGIVVRQFFETPPVHPVAIVPDGHTLAVCNLPDCTVELFDLTAVPCRVASAQSSPALIPSPCASTRHNELWVVNHISDSISIVDPARLHNRGDPGYVRMRPLMLFHGESIARLRPVIPARMSSKFGIPTHANRSRPN